MKFRVFEYFLFLFMCLCRKREHWTKIWKWKQIEWIRVKMELNNHELGRLCPTNWLGVRPCVSCIGVWHNVSMDAIYKLRQERKVSKQMQEERIGRLLTPRLIRALRWKLEFYCRGGRELRFDSIRNSSQIKSYDIFTTDVESLCLDFCLDQYSSNGHNLSFRSPNQVKHKFIYISRATTFMKSPSRDSVVI